MSLVVEVLTGGVRGGTSILYAALGETVSERAGVVNLGTEGSMLVRRARRRTPWPPRRATRGRRGRPGASPAALLAARPRVLRAQPRREPARHRPRRAVPRARPHVAVRRRLRAGATIDAVRAVRRSRCSVDIPLIGEIFFDQDPLIYLSYLAGPGAAGGCLFRSRWGVLLRAAGERTEVLDAPTATRRSPCSTSPSSSAACSPASAAPSCRSPTPTPGSRT